MSRQIKTIREKNSVLFDYSVNDALKEGWRLRKRYSIVNDFCVEFVAELEMETGSCDDCRHHGKSLMEEPCNQCNFHDKWEGKETPTEDHADSETVALVI